MDGREAAEIMYGQGGKPMPAELTSQHIAELQKPLDKTRVKSRKQGWGSVDYVEAWQTIDEANRIFNFAWSRETIYCKEVCRYEVTIGKENKPGWKVGYEAKVRIEVAGLVKEGTGYGCGTMTDLFDCIESAGKEAESDAMKRAFIMLGYSFGLALYDKERQHVEDVKAAPKAPNPPKAEPTPEQKLKAATKATNDYLAVLAETDSESVATIEVTYAEKLQKIHSGYPELSRKIKDATALKHKEAADLLNQFKGA